MKLFTILGSIAAVTLSACGGGSSSNVKPMSKEEMKKFESREATLAGGDKIRTTNLRLNDIAVAVKTFRYDQNRWPNTLEELSQRPADVAANHWPTESYYTGMTKDAWGNAILYKNPGSGTRDFDIISLGADGQEGGDGFAADLGSTE